MIDLNACPIILNLARALTLKMVQLYLVQSDNDDDDNKKEDDEEEDDEEEDGVVDEPASITQAMCGSVVVKTVSSELALMAFAHHLCQ